MFDRFGEFGSAAEINETAVNLRKEGDTDSLKVLAEETASTRIYWKHSLTGIFFTYVMTCPPPSER